MKRYYISPIIGDGTSTNPFRAKVSDYDVNATAVIPTGPDGRPLFAWCLAKVAAIDHALLLADTTLEPLPDFPLDAKMTAMHGPTKDRMQQGLGRFSISVDVGRADGFRDVVRGVGRQLDADFHEDSFDVKEP